jgi:hypothetical protein
VAGTEGLEGTGGFNSGSIIQLLALNIKTYLKPANQQSVTKNAEETP